MSDEYEYGIKMLKNASIEIEGLLEEVDKNYIPDSCEIIDDCIMRLISARINLAISEALDKGSDDD